MNTEYDPYNCEEQYEQWKKNGMKLEGLTKENTDILRQYLKDMEIGKNVNPKSKRGGRGYGRLIDLRSKLKNLFILFQKHLNKKDITKLTSDELLSFFHDMRKGKIMSISRGTPYKSTGIYVKRMKSFWNWYQRAQRKKGFNIDDITIDLDGKDPKPKFNYFTAKQVQKLSDHVKFFYKVLILFLFDSGIRAPTELLNVRKKDFNWDDKTNCYILHIREEISKSFGRKIKLLLCSEVLKDYLQKFNSDDQVFNIVKPHKMNDYLRRTGYKVLKIGKKITGEKGYDWYQDGLTLYDFRHSSACYWLRRYKGETALKYRFGWKKSDMVFYYSEFLGLKDDIREEDLYVDITKPDLQKQIEKQQQETELIKEQFKKNEASMKEQISQLSEIILKLAGNQKIRLTNKFTDNENT